MEEDKEFKSQENKIQEKKEPAFQTAEPSTIRDSEEELLEDRSAKLEITEAELIKERKEKVIKFLKTRHNWISYIALAIIVFIAIRIRTRNLDGLRDITTGTWTLGPDLDPFFFLRLAEYIVENGSLFLIDTMRYVPLGFNMEGEYLLHPYLMAWFHKLAIFFGSESVTHSAVLYPVFMFALTVIAFFLLAREIFLKDLGEKQANIIGLLSAFFLSVIPVLLPRTIAGIPEKESAAFLFMFLALYFFLAAWNSDKNIFKYSFIIFSAISATAMASIWGGYIFVFLTLAPTIFIAFLIGKIDKNKFYIFLIWMASSFIFMYFSSVRYSLRGLFTSTGVAPVFIVLFIITTHSIILNTKLKNFFKFKTKIPLQIISAVLSVIILAIVATILLGPSFIPNKINGIIDQLVTPATSRLIQTVAENKQPFFTEWVGSFGPYIRKIPIFFWLFFIGSVYLFYKMIYPLKRKERIYLTASYLIFLSAIMFSRYSPNSTLNGTNSTSLSLYAFGFILLVFVLGFYYYKYYKEEKQEQLKKISFGLILVITLFTLSIVAARAAVRTIMMLAIPASIIVSSFIVVSFNDAIKLKNKTLKMATLVLVAVIILAAIFSGYRFYKEIDGQAVGYAPSVYTQQWQKAMGWVRENTPENAVFGHWWDYGYWLQSIGERATVLDGGNAMGYWNHLMGRYALTGPNENDALEFLYAHNTTHFLIDSTDIGKYTAFSSIGSDVNYDRRSWLTTFLRDNNQVRETKNSTIYVYTGGTSLDEDVLYEDNGTRVFLPGGKAGIGIVLIEKDSSGNLVGQPQGIFIHQNQQYKLPLRYAFLNGEFLDFNSGIESGVFLFPRVDQNTIEKDGALLYLSKRTVKSQLARLYLYKQDTKYFKLVHSEDDFIVSQIKAQNPQIEDIVFFNGLRGPIRIWEINYQGDIKFKEEYIQTDYPEEISIAR